MSRTLIAEWWEVWIRPPGLEPCMVKSYGHPVHPRIPRDAFPCRAEAIREKRVSGRFARVVHVRRWGWS